MIFTINSTYTGSCGNYTLHHQHFGSTPLPGERARKRKAVRLENKENYRSFLGDQMGRPFHLRKWYR